MRSACLLALTALLSLPLHADDGAASIGAGGIILMKREPRISMAKEVLQISPTKVIVDYDFRNDSAESITTEVAFPIPAYERGELNWKAQGFDDFKLTIEEKPAIFITQVRAFVAAQEITDVLQAMHIDAASFGHDGSQIRRLTVAQRNRLATLKAIDVRDSDQPLWRVEKKYHWAQTFPARGTIHIRHEYTPVLGNSNSIGDPTRIEPEDEIDEYLSVCPTPALRRSLAKASSTDESLISIAYVDFILTTANTWKTPIEDFTLLIEKPLGKERRVNDVSFCWNGPVIKVDANHLSAHAADVAPRDELRIGFITGNSTRIEKIAH